MDDISFRLGDHGRYPAHLMSDNDAESIVSSIRDRLIAIADNPPYRYVATSERDKARFESGKRTFKGYSESSIQTAERELSISFPSVYRAYLRIMGNSHGDLFRGSNVATINDFVANRAFADELLAENDVNFELDDRTIVFIEHHGYTFCYFKADGSFDCPIHQYVEGDGHSNQCSSGFAELLDSEVSTMENNNAKAREAGGYFLTVNDGQVSENHPARASGIRPLELSDSELEKYIRTSGNYKAKPWWRFW